MKPAHRLNASFVIAIFQAIQVKQSNCHFIYLTCLYIQICYICCVIYTCVLEFISLFYVIDLCPQCNQSCSGQSHFYTNRIKCLHALHYLFSILYSCVEKIMWNNLLFMSPDAPAHCRRGIIADEWCGCNLWRFICIFRIYEIRSGEGLVWHTTDFKNIVCSIKICLY